MAHKIHMGAQLPSVMAGKPYQIVGHNETVADYSTVHFPAEDARNCGACHDGTATQSNNMFKPTMAACGSCHDNVNFATGENHDDLPQISNNQCANCHTVEGELEFDASIRGAHTIARFSRELAGLKFEIISVTNAGPGKKPVVVFSLKDNAGNPLRPSQLTRLSLVMAGPNTDYIGLTGGAISESALNASCASDASSCWYTFSAAIPADAKGSYTMGIEGRRDETIYPGTKLAQLVRDSGLNKVVYFSVDGSKVMPRRTIVATSNCNKCHYSLSLHGGSRNQVEQCVLCHNPTKTANPASSGTQPSESIDFPVMIHKIHSGANLATPFSISGTSFADVRYPPFSPSGGVGERRNCSMCHVNGSEQLPLTPGHADVSDPGGYLNPVGPISAACLSCHDSIATASHALANTTRLGESCTTCHDTNAEFSVSKVHAR
jgi:OmcA/MtrC family decaheme c-type cytochrome